MSEEAEKLIERLNSDENIDYSVLSYNINMYNLAKRAWKNDIKTSFSTAMVNRLINYIESIPEENIRTINEKDIAKGFDMYKVYIKSDTAKKLEKFEYDLAFKFARTSILPKQFDGLRRINLMKFNKDVISDIQKYDIVQNNLNNMHQDLAPLFVELLGKIWKFGIYNPTTVEVFWKISSEQTVEVVAERYLEQWPTLYKNLPRGKSSDLFKLLISSTFTAPILKFIRKIAVFLSAEDKATLIDSIWEKGGDHKLIYADAFDALVPKNNPQFVQKIFSVLKTDTDFALTMLSKVWVPLQDTASKDFDTVIEVGSSLLLLNVVKIIFDYLNEPLSEGQFNKLKEHLNNLISDNQEEVTSFIMKSIPQKCKVFTQKQLNDLHVWMCDISGKEGKYVSLIIFIFERMNGLTKDSKVSYSSLTGMNAMWSYFFETSSSQFSDYMINLAIRAEAIPQLIESCLSRDFTVSTLYTLTNVVYRIETPLDLKSMGIIRNAYIPSNGYITIKMAGDYKEPITIPYQTTGAVFKEKVAYIVGCESKRMTFNTFRGELADNYIFKNEETVNVSIPFLKSAPKVPPKASLPSQILKKKETMQKLFACLDGEDSELAKYSLSLLNLLETESFELDLIKSGKNWDKFFDTTKIPHLVYRLNTVAKKFDEKENSFVEEFFMNGGFQNLFEILLSDIDFRNTFYLENYTQVLNMAVGSATSIPEAEQTMMDVFRSLGVDKCMKAIIEKINFSLGLSPYCIVSLVGVLRSVAKLEPLKLLQYESIQKFFESLIFNQDYHVQNSFTILMSDYKGSDIENLVISSLDKSIDGLCDYYFRMMTKIAQETSKPESLWSLMKDCALNKIFRYEKEAKLMEGFDELEKEEDPSLPPPSEEEDSEVAKIRSLKRREFSGKELHDGASELLAVIPPENYVCGVYDTLNVLVDRIEGTIEEAKELVEFSLRKVAMNPYRYLKTPNSLYQMVVKLSLKDNEIAKSAVSICENAIEHYHAEKDTVANGPFLFDHKEPRGIGNMGCTCYLNSSIQQIFRMTAIKDAVLGYEPKGDIPEDPIAQLALLFARLHYFPSTSIDASPFVKTFKIGSNYIKPMEQMDAQEFVAAVLDQIDEKVAGKPVTAHATGTIEHHIKSITPGKEWEGISEDKFTTFTLEVLGQSNIQQSFKVFQTPDHFDEYNTDDESIGKVDAERYHHIKTPPEVFIAHLKRFDFDMMTFERIKINSEYTFPTVLDLSPIMTDESTECLYDLAGIVIHNGSSFGGHYYSYVKQNGKWLCCNDSKVSKITESYALENSRGGTYNTPILDKNGNDTGKKKERADNAYMLVYKKQGIDESEMDPITYMRPEILDAYLQYHQMTFLRNEILGSPFNNFLRSISNDCPDSRKLVFYTAMKACNAPAGVALLSGMQTMIERLISKDDEFTRFIVSQEYLIKQMMTDSKSTTRTFISNMLCAAIRKLKDEAKTVIDSILSQINILWEDHKNIKNEFEPIIEYIKNVEGDRSEIIKKLLDFASEDFHKKFPENRDKILPEVAIGNAFKAVTLCINSDNVKEISDRVLDQEFMDEWFMSPQTVFDFAELVFTCIKDNEEMTEKYIKGTLEHANALLIPAHFASIVSFKDTLSIKRVDAVYEALNKLELNETGLAQVYSNVAKKLKGRPGDALNQMMRVKNLWLIKSITSHEVTLRRAVADLIYSLFDFVPEWQRKEYGGPLYPPSEPMPELTEEQTEYIKELFDTIMDNIKDFFTAVKTSTKVLFNGRPSSTAFPSTQFLEVLGWAAYSGRLESSINAVFMTQLFKRVAKVRDMRVGTYDCIFFTYIITKNGNVDMINKESLAAILSSVDQVPSDSTAAQYVSFITAHLYPAIIMALPKNRDLADRIVRSDLFINSMLMMNGAQTEKLALELINIVPNDIAEIVWDKESFKHSIKNPCATFITLTRELLKKKSPTVINTFQKNGCHTMTVESLDSSLTAFKATPQMHPLIALLDIIDDFNNAYSALQKKPKMRDDFAEFWQSKTELIKRLIAVIQEPTTPLDVSNKVLSLLSSIFIIDNPQITKLSLEMMEPALIGKINPGVQEFYSLLRINLLANYWAHDLMFTSAVLDKDVDELKKVRNHKIVVQYCYAINNWLPLALRSQNDTILGYIGKFAQFTSEYIKQREDACEPIICEVAIKLSKQMGTQSTVKEWFANLEKVIRKNLEILKSGKYDQSVITMAFDSNVRFLNDIKEILQEEATFKELKKDEIENVINILKDKQEKTNKVENDENADEKSYDKEYQKEKFSKLISHLETVKEYCAE